MGQAVAFFVAVVALLVTLYLVEVRRRRRRRARFAASRSAMPDSEFVLRSEVDRVDADACVAVRSALARFVGVPPETLHADEDMRAVWALDTLADFDGVEFVMHLEEELDLVIPDEEAARVSWGFDRPVQVGEFVKEVARICQSSRRDST